MSRNEVAVGTVSDSVMFATRRTAGPVIGVAPWGGGTGDGGEVVAARTTDASPVPRPSSPGITGSSASRPLSNRSRHSWPTDDGSRRYSSYITCTKAALCVPKTNSLTGWNLTYLICQNGFTLSHARPAPSSITTDLPQRQNRRSHCAGSRTGGRRLLSRPDDPRLPNCRRPHAVPRCEHDEDPGHDSTVPRPGRGSAVARRLHHPPEHVSIDRRQLALSARRHRRLRLVAVQAPRPARADSRADRADGNGVEQPRHESADHQSLREARERDGTRARR